MSTRRIGVGGPFLVEPSIGISTTTVKVRPIIVIEVQAVNRSILRSRLKTTIKLGKVFGQRPIFPAAIWVTLATKKRTSLNPRIISRWALGEPTLPVVVVATSKIKPIRLVTLVEFKRNSPKTKVQFTSKFGKPTTKTKVSGPLIVEFVSKQRKPLRGTVKLQKPTKPVVIVIQGVKRQLLVRLNKASKKQQKTKFGFTKVFGRPTKKPNIRPIVVLKFANTQVVRIKKFTPGKSKLGRPVISFGTSPTGSVVIFYDGLSMADGLTLHKHLSRPHIVLTPAGGGNFTVVKDSTNTDMKSTDLNKETYIIDGELP